MHGSNELTPPASTNRASATVTITACRDYSAANIDLAIQRQFAMLGADTIIKPGDCVLIKPNLIAPRPPAHPAQTSPAVILATARTLIDLGAKPFVSDSPAWNSLNSCIKALELEEPLKKLNVPVKPFKKYKLKRIAGTHLKIATVALEADRIINLPKLKTHQQLGATFAVKNMFGCVCGKQKAVKHFSVGKSDYRFCKMLLGIYELLAPAFTIIDSVVAMEGKGPINGTAKTLGFLAGGTDPIACELICSQITKLNSEKLPIVQTAKKLGVYCDSPEMIDVIGDSYTDLICEDFQHPEMIPLDFSLLRVCKSMAKQIVFLTRSALAGKSRL